MPAGKSIALTAKCEAGFECRIDNNAAVCAQSCTPDPQKPYECMTLDNGKTVFRACKKHGTQYYWEIYSNSYCDADSQMLIYCANKGEVKTLACSKDNASQCSSDKTQCLAPNCAFSGTNTACSDSYILSCQNTANHFGLHAIACKRSERCEMAAPNKPVCVSTCPDSEITTLGICNKNTLSVCKNTGTDETPVYSVVDTTCANGCAYFHKMAACIN